MPKDNPGMQNPWVKDFGMCEKAEKAGEADEDDAQGPAAAA